MGAPPCALSHAGLALQRANDFPPATPQIGTRSAWRADSMRILLINDTRLVGHHGSSAVVDVILQQFAARGIEVVSHLQQRIDLGGIDRYGFKAVVINGEGAMHRGQKSSHFFSRLAQDMSSRGMPIFLINTVYDETTPEIVERMHYFTGVYCRETPSVRRLAAQGVGAELCPDLTYALEMPEGLAWCPGPRIVVLDTTVAGTNRTLHAFCRDNGLLFQPIRCSPRLLSIALPKNLLRIVRFNTTKLAGRLLPGVYNFARYANGVTDRREFLRRLADGTLVVVAARFHGVCLCMKAGVPFLAISSNTPKIEGMLADAGLSHRMLDIPDLDVGRIEARAVWTAADEAKRVAYVEAAKVSIARMFDGIARKLQ
jgi:hypothetical protein